ncbi:hypothetical protein EIP86_002683 [Pleurotus ostreatoroseus]|nr:hypothetical protein EIP86_002683 [Pleurotus ostreatoroseus]
MDDPFPDKNHLHYCLHTTTRNYVKALYEHDLLWYASYFMYYPTDHTCTSLRIAIEKGLSLPLGYFDTLMYRTIIRRTAVSVRDQLRLEDERKRASSQTKSVVVPLGQSKSRSPFNTDLYHIIAEYLPKPSLHALALTCRETTVAAQRELFRDVQIFCRGREGKERLEKVTVFFAGNPRIARYVQRLTAQTCDLEEDIVLTAAQVQDIITALPRLEHLTLMCFQWHHDTRFVPSAIKHEHLHHLELCSIRVKEVLGSPMEILRLAKTWYSLKMEYVTHPQVAIALGHEPIPVPHLRIHHFPWFNMVLTVPDECDILCGAVTINCDHVVDGHCRGLANIINLSTDTLKWMRFAISPFDRLLTPLPAWQEFFDSLNRCRNLEKLTLQIGIPSDEHIVEGRERDAERFDEEAAFLSAIISAVSNTITCLDIVLDLRGAWGCLAHKKFGLVHWATIGNAVKKTSRLQYAGVRYKAVTGKIGSWPKRQIAKMQDIFLHNNKLINTLDCTL